MAFEYSLATISIPMSRPHSSHLKVNDCAGFLNETFSVSKRSTGWLKPLPASWAIQNPSIIFALCEFKKAKWKAFQNHSFLQTERSEKAKLFAMKTRVLKSPFHCSSPLLHFASPRFKDPPRPRLLGLHGTRTLGSQEPRAKFPHCMSFCFKQLLPQSGRSPNLIFFLEISAWFCVHHSFVSQLLKWHVLLSRPLLFEGFHGWQLCKDIAQNCLWRRDPFTSDTTFKNFKSVAIANYVSVASFDGGADNHSPSGPSFGEVSQLPFPPSIHRNWQYGSWLCWPSRSIQKQIPTSEFESKILSLQTELLTCFK